MSCVSVCDEERERELHPVYGVKNGSCSKISEVFAVFNVSC